MTRAITSFTEQLFNKNDKVSACLFQVFHTIKVWEP